MITRSGVDPLFLHVWLKVHKFENDQLDLRTKKIRTSVTYHIENEVVLDQLESDFQDFKAKNCSVETYFDIDILFFKENSQHNYKPVKRTPMTRRVVVLGKNRSGKFTYTNLIDFKSDYPIEMSIKSILSIYDIHEPVCVIPNHQFNLNSLEEKYKVCVELYKKRGNMCQLDYNLPGIKHPGWEPNHRIRIGVDHLDIPYLPKFYWIPSDQLISTELFCTKMPGKCGYSTFHLGHFKSHEIACTDETKVESQQVIVAHKKRVFI